MSLSIRWPSGVGRVCEVLTNYETPWSRVVEKLTVPHLVKKFPYIVEPEVSLPYLGELETSPYPEIDESSPHIPIQSAHSNPVCTLQSSPHTPIQSAHSHPVRTLPSSPHTPIQSAHSHTVRTLLTFFKSILILSFPLHLRILNDLFLSWFANKSLLAFMFSPVHVTFSLVYQCNRPNIWRGVQIMKVLIMHFSPVSC